MSSKCADWIDCKTFEDGAPCAQKRFVSLWDGNFTNQLVSGSSYHRHMSWTLKCFIMYHTHYLKVSILVGTGGKKYYRSVAFLITCHIIIRRRRRRRRRWRRKLLQPIRGHFCVLQIISLTCDGLTTSTKHRYQRHLSQGRNQAPCIICLEQEANVFFEILLDCICLAKIVAQQDTIVN